MIVLIDMGSIKSGGGAQLAFNFLELLNATSNVRDEFIILLPPSGPLANYTFSQAQWPIYVSPGSFLKRWLFDYIHLKKIFKRHSITHIFTFFGMGLPHPPSIKSIITVAFPTICHPDSVFWQYVPLNIYLKVSFFNFVRIQRIRNANLILVETLVMQHRLADHLKIPHASLALLSPVPTHFVQAAISALPFNGHIRFVLVGSLDQHKNVWRLPEIALELIALGFNRFKFVLTNVQEEYVTHPKIQANLSLWLSVQHHFEFLGTVHPRDINRVYEKAHALLILSDFESFSNNYMEAWKAGIPLISSDRDFAHHICGGSAYYVEPHEPKSCAKRLIDFTHDEAVRRTMVEEGKNRLSALGTDMDRFHKVMQYLKSV